MIVPLGKIVSVVREDLAERKRNVPLAMIEAKARRAPRSRSLREVLRNGPGIIAEIKRASPSKGWIRKELDPAKTARAYAAGGACAVSVLTENRYFRGSLSDLLSVREVCGDLPVLRKDFLLDAYMVAESRAYGADLVLLIVSVLGEETERMLQVAKSYGMEALVEVHDEAEMETAIRSGATLIGINNRDLKTLRVDLSVSQRLLPLAPPRAVKVVESGITDPSQVRRLHLLGADAFLVGESLVRSADPAETIRILRGGHAPDMA